MIHFTSRVVGDVKIGKGVPLSLASSGGCYLQGNNGIVIGDDTIFAPGVKIVSANHAKNDFSRWDPAEPIRIGKQCWIGANAVILPGVQLGDDVVVGAGAVVTKSFPQGSVLAGVPAKRIRSAEPSASCAGDTAVHGRVVPFRIGLPAPEYQRAGRPRE